MQPVEQLPLMASQLTACILIVFGEAISLVSQEAVLFDDTIAANIGFGRDGAGRAAIEAAARDAAADDFIQAFPDGYDTYVGAMGNRLSGGQRQRHCHSPTMLKDAPILLLDEATAALDAKSEQQVQSAIQKLQTGRTTLVAFAHHLATVRNADLILVLEDGRIIEEGIHEYAAGKRRTLCTAMPITIFR